jgi:ankyrin repeat protein
VTDLPYTAASEPTTLNYKDKYGRTPLSNAAMYGRDAVVRLLLETGQVDVESKDKSDQTPLL